MDTIELSRSLDRESSDTHMTNTATKLHPEDAIHVGDTNLTDTEDTDVDDPEDVSSPKHGKHDRWQLIDFGLIHHLFSFLLRNVSAKVCGVLTILTTVGMAISDTIPDLIIAATLFPGNIPLSDGL